MGCRLPGGLEDDGEPGPSWLIGCTGWLSEAEADGEAECRPVGARVQAAESRRRRGRGYFGGDRTAGARAVRWSTEGWDRVGCRESGSGGEMALQARHGRWLID